MTTLKRSDWWMFRPLFAWLLIAVAASAFVSFFLSLQTGVFLLLFLALAWWAWEHPEDGFLFLIVIAPLLPMLKITQTIGTVTLLKDVLILTLTARLVVVPLLQQRLPYRRNVLAAPLAALAAWTIVSMLRSDDYVLGVLRARDILLYPLLYLAVLYLQHDWHAQRARLRFFSAVVIIVLLLGIYQWFFAADSAVLRFDPQREVWIPRLSSLLAHPSIFGQYLVAVGTVAGAAGLVLNGRARMLMLLLAAATLPFVYLTYSRAVWLGLTAAVLALVTAWGVQQVRSHLPRRYVAGWGSAVGAAGGAAIIMLALYTPVGVFLRSAFDPTYGSNEERIEFMARLVAPLTNKEAMLGRGLGDVLEQNFREANVTTYDIAAGQARAVQLAKNRTLVDNQWLKTGVEMGLAGLIIYSWMFVRLAKHSWQLAVQKKNMVFGDGRYQQMTGLATLAFLAAFVIQGFFIDIWDIFPTNAMFWVMAALASAAGVPTLSATPDTRAR